MDSYNGNEHVFYYKVILADHCNSVVGFVEYGFNHEMLALMLFVLFCRALSRSLSFVSLVYFY